MKAPKTLLVRGILWTCERPGSWVSKIGRIDQIKPSWWACCFSVVVAAAYPDLTATGHTMRSCAVLAAVRLQKARGAR